MTTRHIRLLALVFPLALVACGASGNGGRIEAPKEPTAAERQQAATELHRLGISHYRNGDSLRAEEYLASALAAGGVPDVILPDLMRISVNGHRYQAAIRYFEDYRSELAGPNRAELELVAGVLYLGVEQPELARASFEKSLELRPGNARAELMLGQVLHDELQDYAVADTHFRAYLELEPEGKGAAIARAGLLKSPAEVNERKARPQKLAPRRAVR
ncbi:MAG TPA: tetratricopeptide repeat protein [Polyangiaceae bacterium]|nr:tetratricopeptide repeat protein [Polyangiaceae bacterium]